MLGDFGSGISAVADADADRTTTLTGKTEQRKGESGGVKRGQAGRLIRESTTTAGSVVGQGEGGQAHK